MGMKTGIEAESGGSRRDTSAVSWLMQAAIGAFSFPAAFILCLAFHFGQTFPASANEVHINVDYNPFIVAPGTPDLSNPSETPPPDIYQPQGSGFWSVNGGQSISMLQAPLGAPYTITYDEENRGSIIVAPVEGAPEPSVTTLNSQTWGTVVSSAPGNEIGVESLTYTGGSGNVAVGGYTISMGLIGGYVASYTTATGDTYQPVFSALGSLLTANGINASISGDTLSMYASVPNTSSLTGAVEASWNDAGLPFEFSVRSITVPEPATLTFLGLGSLMILACGRWRGART
jgi:hypothetical protein